MAMNLCFSTRLWHFSELYLQSSSSSFFFLLLFFFFSLVELTRGGVWIREKAQARLAADGARGAVVNQGAVGVAAQGCAAAEHAKAIRSQQCGEGSTLRVA